MTIGGRNVTNFGSHLCWCDILSVTSGVRMKTVYLSRKRFVYLFDGKVQYTCEILSGGNNLSIMSDLAYLMIDHPQIVVKTHLPEYARKALRVYGIHNPKIKRVPRLWNWLVLALRVI